MKGLAGFVLVAATVAVAAQSQQPTFRTRADAVTLDVTVLDKSGRTVTDLTAADFEVIEQGTPQKIEAFSLVDMASRPAMSSNLYHEIRTLSSQEQELVRPESRVFIIFLNDYHVRLQDQWQVRNQVGDFVRGLDPRDLVAIMYPLTPTSGLSFSRDHDADARLVEKFEGRQGLYTFPKGPIEEEQIRRTGGNAGSMEAIRRDVVRTALQGLCTYLGSIREGRKSVLFVSDWAPGGLTGFAFDDFRQIQREAARSNTAIYTYDPQGLTMGRPNQWLQTLAEQTGGRATVNTNNGRAGMQRMVQESEAYYLIGYTSTENPRDGKFHEVKVRVKRQGVELRAKPGYWAYDAEAIERAAAPPPPAVDPDVSAALEAAESPGAAHPMLVWAGVDHDASGAALVNVIWEAADPTQPIDHAEVTATSSTTSFRGRGERTVSFAAKPGDLSIRVAARGVDDSPVDTTVANVTVPPAAMVQISTPAFFRGRTARLINASDALPTASREFTKQDQVAVRVRGWAAAGAPVIAARLLNDHGELLNVLPAEATAPGAATITVPIGALALGRYVLEVAATAGTDRVRALAAFRVK